MQPTDDPTMPGWSGEDLVSTIRSAAGLGADAGMPSVTRFVAAIAKLVKRREATATPPGPTKPGVFLLLPTPPNTIAQEVVRVPMLDNGLTELNGRLWFVGEVAVSGRFIELVDKGDDEIFTWISSDLGLGSVPAVIVDPRTTHKDVRFYPKGLCEADTCEILTLRGTDITPQSVYDVVDLVYRRFLMTPEAQEVAGKMWTEGDRHWPASRAEQQCQLYLHVGLQTAFPTCIVRSEQPAVPGRFDLQLEESDPLDRSQVARHATLELKVIKSFRSTGTHVPQSENDAAIDSGVRQAGAYKEEWSSRFAALCVFDMQASDNGETCFAQVAELAKNLGVLLWRWFLYGSSEEYRATLA